MDRGQRYLFARNRANVSNARVAEEIGVSRQSTQKWELSGVPTERIEAVAAYLECCPRWLSGSDSATDSVATAIEGALNGHDLIKVASIVSYARMVLGVAP